MIKKILNLQVPLFGYTISPKSIVANPLFAGSAMMVLGSNLANFFAYIYHVVIGRMLGPVDYGILAAIISLIGLINTSFTFFGLVIVKFASAGTKEEQHALFSWLYTKIIMFGLALSVMVSLILPILSSFLHIDRGVLILLAPILFLSVVVFFYRSFLQGVLKFKELVISTNLEMFGRFILGLILVYAGFSVFGAVVGILSALLIVVFVLRFLLKDYRKLDNKQQFSSARKMFSYGIPVFISNLSTQSFLTIDVILAKHFFAPHEAGIYASLSTIGKIVYFGTAPILSVMFPIVSQRHAKGLNYTKILLMTILMVGSGAVFIALIFYLFPQAMISILYGNAFNEGAKYLVWFGLYMAIFTLASIFVSFFLSLNKTKIIYSTALIASLQVVGIWLYHNSILQVIQISILVVSFLLLVLLIYFGYEKRKSRD